MKFAWVWVVAASALRGGVVRAQDVGPPAPKFPTKQMTQEEGDKEKERLEKEITGAFEAKEYARAEGLLRELVPLDHENFVPWYNLACALSMQDKTDEAMQMLQQAIARGFADKGQMLKDPHLERVRHTEGFANLVAAWGKVVQKRTEMTIERAKKQFRVGEPGSPYVCEKNETLRLVYISAFDPELFKQAKEDAARLKRWWDELAGVEGGGAEASRREGKKDAVGSPTAAGAGSGAASQADVPWVLVVLPTRADYIVWAQKRYGDRYDRVGGEYDHGAKLLTAMDLGSSWRHEFWHLLHWRHMDQLGQRHPLWVMEGLCSLVEDCEEGPHGEFVPKPSWRTNMVKRLNKGGALIPFETMFATGKQRFMGDRTLAYYGQARAMFLYLHEKGKLRAWYGELCRGYREDPSGRAAFEKVCGGGGVPLKEVEKDFKAWLRDLPEVAEEVGRGRANLPVDVGIGSGDGPVVRIDSLAEFANGQRGAGGPDTGGLRDKDVIVAIDGKAVRDLNDLARVLGSYDAGAVVKVEYIRRGKHAEGRVKLVGPR